MTLKIKQSTFNHLDFVGKFKTYLLKRNEKFIRQMCIIYRPIVIQQRSPNNTKNDRTMK